jgi:Xaa-Pro aminopeptidase
VSAAVADSGLDALVVTPGHDMTYLCGYRALPLERLTALLIRPGGDPLMVVPELERPAAEASPVGRLGLAIHSWQETEDPFQLVASHIRGAERIAVDDRMWARTAFALRDAVATAAWVTAGDVIADLRLRKTHAEVVALQAAGAAIDEVHAQVAGLLRPGRTEREVGGDIADLILASGHSQVDFVIVAGGENGASPHHEVSDRVLQLGDPVVVDIGGTMPSGYCSDSTRTYAVGEPPPEFVTAYAALQLAQAAAVAHARAGVSCESVDAAAREVLVEAGLGEAFIHRTGHGIGLETHEEPYIVTGNTRLLEPGMAFSVEPGFYLQGRFGARIEDIVVCTETGVVNCNNRPRELIVAEV